MSKTSALFAVVPAFALLVASGWLFVSARQFAGMITILIAALLMFPPIIALQKATARCAYCNHAFPRSERGIHKCGRCGEYLQLDDDGAVTLEEWFVADRPIFETPIVRNPRFAGCALCGEGVARWDSLPNHDIRIPYCANHSEGVTTTDGRLLWRSLGQARAYAALNDELPNYTLQPTATRAR